MLCDTEECLSVNVSSMQEFLHTRSMCVCQPDRHEPIYPFPQDTKRERDISAEETGKTRQIRLFSYIHLAPHHTVPQHPNVIMPIASLSTSLSQDIKTNVLSSTQQLVRRFKLVLATREYLFAPHKESR